LKNPGSSGKKFLCPYDTHVYEKCTSLPDRLSHKQGGASTIKEKEDWKGKGENSSYPRENLQQQAAKRVDWHVPSQD